jgi:hypothetical protein
VNLAAVAQLTDGARRLQLTRAWPRGEGVVHLEYASDAGPVAGQLVEDPRRLARIAGATGAPASVLQPAGVLLHHGGADRRLPALGALVAAPRSRLLAHRPERRAVVRRADGCYVKVLRPGRTEAVATALRHVEALAGEWFRVPVLREHRPDDGVLVWSDLAGPTLHDLAVAGAPDPAQWHAVWAAAGRALRALHDGPQAGLPSHRVADECRATLRWVEPAQGLRLLLPVDVTAVLAPLRAGEPGPLGVLHRDLHDKQVVVAPGGPPGLLDVDTLAVGERALDVANVLVHLELRVRQGLLTPAAATLARDAFLDALAPADATLGRVAAYAPATRLRLAGVYAFRPRWGRLARALLDEVVRGEVDGDLLRDPAGHSQRNVRTASTPAAAAQATSTPTAAQGSPAPSRSTSRSPSDSAPAGSSSSTGRTESGKRSSGTATPPVTNSSR